MHRLIQHYRRLSIRAKLTTIGMLASGVALLVTVALFLGLDRVSYRNQIIAQARILARTVGTVSKTALANADRDSALLLLETLAADCGVLAAQLLNTENMPLARFESKPVPKDICESVSSGSTPSIKQGYVLVREPIMSNGKKLGAVCMIYSAHSLQRRLRWGLSLALVIMTGSVAIAILLSWSMQHLVSRPILQLTHTVETITREHDFTLRARSGGLDEVDVLVSGFNGMLDQIQARDSRLKLYQKQLRKMADRLLITGERERRQIAVGIHDTICQSLWGAMMRAQHLATKTENKQIREELAEFVGMLKEALAEARALTFELSPPSLYDLGLGPALMSLANEMKRHYKLNVTIVGAKIDTGLDNDTSIVLYRSIRELLINVHKYADTDQARVVLARAEDRVRIVVSDQGCGFDPNQIESEHGGFGLFSIREHLYTVRGTMSIASSIGHGATITLEVPAGELATRAATDTYDERIARG